MTKQTSSQWVPALAGYRALAALAVFAFHIASIDPHPGAIGRWTTPLGNAAVSLFFVLSGYLIYRPFALWALDAGPPVNSRRFIARRAGRIIPLYWFVLTVHLFITNRGDASTLGEYLTAYGLVQNFRGPMVFIPPFVAWSLSIEIWFSFALPIIAAAIRTIGRGRTVQARFHVQLAGIAWLAGFAIVFRIWALSGPPDSGRILWMPAYLDWFAAGLFLAVVTTYWKRFPPPVTVVRLGANAWILGVAALTAYWGVTQLGLPGGFVSPTAFQTHNQFLLEGLMSLLLVGAAVIPGSDLGAAGRFLSSRVLAVLGLMSYGIYLIHPVVTDTLLDHRPGINRWTLTAIALTGTLCAAYLAHHIVEAPSSKFIDGLVGRDKPVPGTAATKPQTRSQPVTQPPSASSGGHRRSDQTTPELVAIVGRPAVLAAAMTAISLASTTLARPGTYVADARYELFADPDSRLSRMFTAWDSTRDLGRTAEEFWPGLTAIAAVLIRFGPEPWLIERILHGLLLSIAAVGAMMLSQTLRPGKAGRSVLVACLYAFGPFSATFLIPSPLYVSYAMAPWLVVAVLRASTGQRFAAWAGFIALSLFAAGNADPPGLLFAMIPATGMFVAVFTAFPSRRRHMLYFGAISIVATACSSAAMLAKTAIGAAALSHRLLETEPTSAIAATSSFTESIRGMGFWLTYFRLGPTTFRTQQALFVSNPWIVMATFLPVVVGVGLLAYRRSRARTFALMLVIVGAVLMVGPHPIESPSPYGQAVLDLFARSNLAFGFRSTHKAGVVLSLGVALLGGWGLADLAAIRISRLGPARHVLAVLVCALVLFLTQPFWRTSLYDPALTSQAVPQHWQDVEEYFRTNTTEGRVLVLPGTTNNGYRWGSVGDDLLDPTVPSRVVASTLPLSTPLGADIVQALNDAVTSPSYQPGTILPIAQRLGITHVIVRNDIDWERQGVARPRELASLRSDPDLTLQASFGPRGLYSSSRSGPPPDPAELELPAIEIFELPGSAPARPSVVPWSGQPRQILLDGDGTGLLNLAASGLLNNNLPIRYGGTLSSDEAQAAAEEAALIVLTDSNSARDRRINYYGYEYTPTEDLDTANSWLPEFATDSMSVPMLATAAVDSSINRWLLGEDHQPGAARDGDERSAWIVPPLLDPHHESWWLDFDASTDAGQITVSLLDADDRVEAVTVRVDGQVVSYARSGTELTLDPTGSLNRIEIFFEDVKAGLSPVGVGEVRFANHDLKPFVRLPNHLLTLIKSDDRVAEDLGGTPLSILLGSQDPTTIPMRRVLELWRADRFTLTAEVVSETTTTRCTSDILTIDNTAIPTRFTPGPGGHGTLELCASVPDLTLGPGTHTMVLTPRDGDRVGLVRWDSVTNTVDITDVQMGDLSPDTDLNDGDLVISSASFDPRWTLGSAEEAAGEPFSLNGQAAWLVSSSGLSSLPEFEPESVLSVAWLITIVGLVASAGLVVFSAFQHREVAESSRDSSKTFGSVVGLALDVAAVGMAYVLVGAPGAAGALLALTVSLRRRSWPIFIGSSFGLFAIAINTAWPLLGSNSELLDPTLSDTPTRIIVGALIASLSISYREFNDASPLSRNSTTQTPSSQELT